MLRNQSQISISITSTLYTTELCMINVYQPRDLPFLPSCLKVARERQDTTEMENADTSV